MKRLPSICLFFLLFIAFSFAGCTMRETAAPVTGPDTVAPSSTPEATATPEPIPTPIPMELVIAQSSPSYTTISEYSQLSDALSFIEEKQGQTLWAQKGDWYVWGLEEAQLTGTRAGEGASAGDIMTTDGEYLYMIADKDLVIVRLAVDGAAAVSRTKIGSDWTAWEDTSVQKVNGSEKIPSAVFCSGDRLVVISDYYNYSSQNGDIGYTEYTAVDVFDISDPAAPVLLTEYGQDGAPAAAKINGKAFVLITDWQYVPDEENADPTAVVPASHYQGQITVLSPDKLMAVTDGSSAGCSVMGVYDLTAGVMSDARAVYGVPADPFFGEGEIIFYVSRVADSYSRSYTDPERGAATEFVAAACTDLYRFVIDENENGSGTVSFDGVYTVEGVIGDSRCLDRYEGQFRCAAIKDERRRTDYENGTHKIERITPCDIMLLDGSMKVAASAEMSDGASDTWVGFLGDRAVLTHENGSILARLSDADALRDTRTLSRKVIAQAIRNLGEKGYSAFYRSEAGKLTLTVYDTELETLFERSFGSDHSSTLENLAGYFTDGASGIIAFSADDSYCVYSFDAEKGLTLKGNVYLSDWAWNARGFVLDGMLYVADTRELFIYNLSDFSVVNQIKF